MEENLDFRAKGIRLEERNMSKHVSRNHPGCEVFSFSFRVSFVRMASLVSSLTMSNELDERPGTISMEAGLSGEIQKGRGAEKNGEEMKNKEWTGRNNKERERER